MFPRARRKGRVEWGKNIAKKGKGRRLRVRELLMFLCLALMKVALIDTRNKRSDRLLRFLYHKRVTKKLQLDKNK